jgi:hypothetical protein
VLWVSNVLQADWIADCENYMEIVRIGNEGRPPDLHSAVQLNENQLVQQITVFIDLQDQLNMFRTNFLHHQERKNVLLCAVMVVVWWSRGRQHGTVCLV